MESAAETRRAIDAVFRIESPRLIAGLTRMVRDVGLAEELAQDALVTALSQWPESGVPRNPGAWLMTTAKRRGIDLIRRRKMADRKHAAVEYELEMDQEAAVEALESSIDAPDGDDMLNLPLLSVGAVGFVSVVGHVVTPDLRALVDAFVSGDVHKATEIHQKLLPVYTGMFRTQGVMTTKAALALQGLPAGPLRAPMVECTPEEIEQLKIDLAAGGVQL